MNIIEINGVAKSFFTQKLYADVNLEINSGDKIALTGHNGVGKSTFIKLIMGEERADRGEVTINEDAKIEYFDQFGKIDLNATVDDLLNQPFEHVLAVQAELDDTAAKFTDENVDMDALMAKYSELTDKFESLGGYSYSHVRDEFVDIFGLSDKLGRKFRELSGGEKQYVRLAITLFNEADLVILDEPLSFFDRKKTAWLAEYIADSRKAFLVISHNVDFIRGFANRIFDIDNFTVTPYDSDYRSFVKAKKEKLAATKKINAKIEEAIHKTYDAYEKKLQLLERCDNKHAQAVILRRMEREMTKLGKDKIKLSKDYKYSYLDAPDAVFFSQRAVEEPELVVLTDVSKSFPGKELYKDVNFTVLQDSKIAIVGENGSGKSTLLNILTGKEAVTSGDVYINRRAKIAFINQETIFPNEKITIAQYLKEKSGLHEEFIEAAIDTLYNDEPEFRDKRIFMLSGGEKKRLEIFANMLAEIDLLIVDEPSTYMDDFSRETIGNMLQEFPGAVIVVTHDKHLLKALDFETYDIRDKRLRIKEQG